MNFVTQAMPMHYINGSQGPYIRTEKQQQELFNQSYKVQITSPVIYGFGGVHTHLHESDFKMSSSRHASGLKICVCLIFVHK